MSQTTRRPLPHESEKKFLTDSGMETTFIFHEGWELPMFESFVLLDDPRGLKAIRDYYGRHAAMAVKHGVGFVLETPTWRANPDWAVQVGYEGEKLAAVNRKAVAVMQEIRDAFENAQSPFLISGNLGPRGDGYDPGAPMAVDVARDYHAPQIALLRDAGVDFISAFTITTSNEALGIAKAAEAAGIPCVISFTLETDGKLPSGETLKDAIAKVDAGVKAKPIYYMINCAHPTHFAEILEDGAPWTKRLGGLRANSSKKSHAELDNSTELDIGDPLALGQDYADLLRRFPQIKVIGGCCGTDHRHIECLSNACLKEAA